MKKRAIIILAFALLLPLQAVQAKGLYVRDWITISVRNSPEGNHVAMANSNDYMEILGENGEWTKVRTPAGKTGWVLTRYLTNKTPKALLVDQLTEKTTAQAAAIEKLSTENKQLRKENREQKYKISTLSSDVSSAQTKFDSLKEASGSYLELKAAHDKLLEDDKLRAEQVKALEKENVRYKTSERIKFFFLGGLFLVFGIGVGGLLQSMRGRNKRTGYKL